MLHKPNQMQSLNIKQDYFYAWLDILCLIIYTIIKIHICYLYIVVVVGELQGDI